MQNNQRGYFCETLLMIDFIHHNMIDIWMKDFVSYNNTNVKEKSDVYNKNS